MRVEPDSLLRRFPPPFARRSRAALRGTVCRVAIVAR